MNLKSFSLDLLLHHRPLSRLASASPNEVASLEGASAQSKAPSLSLLEVSESKEAFARLSWRRCQDRLFRPIPSSSLLLLLPPPLTSSLSAPPSQVAVEEVASSLPGPWASFALRPLPGSSLSATLPSTIRLDLIPLRPHCRMSAFISPRRRRPTLSEALAAARVRSAAFCLVSTARRKVGSR